MFQGVPFAILASLLHRTRHLHLLCYRLNWLFLQNTLTHFISRFLLMVEKRKHKKRYSKRNIFTTFLLPSFCFKTTLDCLDFPFCELYFNFKVFYLQNKTNKSDLRTIQILGILFRKMRDYLDRKLFFQFKHSKMLYIDIIKTNIFEILPLFSPFSIEKVGVHLGTKERLRGKS